jgi:RNA polymerase sigma factor (sigma-70 family)
MPSTPATPGDPGEADDEEIGEFYQRMSPELVSYARRHWRSGPAEDIVHDAIVQMIKRWPKINPATRDRYAYRTVRHTLVTWFRKFGSGREDLVAEPDPPPDQTPRNPVELAVVAADLAARVADLIGRLPPAEAYVLLRWANGMSPEEIAEARGVTVKTVRTKLASARGRLRVDLKDQEGQS